MSNKFKFYAAIIIFLGVNLFFFSLVHAEDVDLISTELICGGSAMYKVPQEGLSSQELEWIKTVLEFVFSNRIISKELRGALVVCAKDDEYLNGSKVTVESMEGILKKKEFKLWAGEDLVQSINKIILKRKELRKVEEKFILLAKENKEYRTDPLAQDLLNASDDVVSQLTRRFNLKRDVSQRDGECG